MLKPKPVMWTRDEGIAEVLKVQTLARYYGYHVCLGGSVLNAGSSRKDLDIYFLGLDNSDITSDPDGMLAALEPIWGTGESLMGSHYSSSRFAHKFKFKIGRKRIDAFIGR